MKAASGARARSPVPERRVILGWLAAVAALCWAYVLYEGASMGLMDMARPDASGWGVPELLMLFAMWVVMMAAMMLPAAMPAALLVAQVNRLYHAGRRPYWRTALFAAGYLAAWSGFSLLATLAQWGLHQANMMTDMMATADATVGGLTLVAAGLYQWTPLKHACLRRCRAPLTFVLTGWRPGNAGAFRMGLAHGAWCLGCCGLLMALLFVAGVMNLAWIVGLSVLVLLEKLLPEGVWVARAAGLALVVWGGLMLLR